MRDTFRGYYAPTDAELNDMWQHGLVVLDTNALLNLFRYSARTRADFESVLNPIRTRLWIPHQVGLEFHKRRLDVIEEQTKAYDEISGAVKSARDSIDKALRGIRLHPSLDKSEALKLLDEGIAPVEQLLRNSKESHASHIVEEGENERVFDLISELYTGRVGPAFSAEELKALYIEGAKRYEANVPPGYKDKDKPEPDRFGDLILWKQVLLNARSDQKPVIFVTDDSKEDWWYRVKGKTQGPRVELIEEFFEACGKRIHFYSPERFLQFAKEKLGFAVNTEAVDEVKRISEERVINWQELVKQNHNFMLSEVRQLRMAAHEKDIELQRVRALMDSMRVPETIGRTDVGAEVEALDQEISYLARELSELEHGGVRDSLESRMRQVHSARAHLLNDQLQPSVESDVARLDAMSRQLAVERAAIVSRLRDAEMHLMRMDSPA